MSPTLSGWAWATTATYVAKDDTQVTRAQSPAISLSGLGGASPCGRAARLSASAILSGNSSRISTNSSAWMRCTSLAGMGTMLFATLKDGSFGFATPTLAREGPASEGERQRCGGG